MALLLVVAHDGGELVVIFGHDVDIALVLERRLRRLQRLVEIRKCILLVLGGHFLVGLDLGNLRLDDGFGADVLLGYRIETASPHADVADDAFVFMVVGKAFFFGTASERGVTLGSGLALSGSFSVIASM